MGKGKREIFTLLDSMKKLIFWIKKDFVSIVFLLISLLVCLYTIYYGSEINNSCNEYWFKQVKTWEEEGICSFNIDDTIYFNYSFINGSIPKIE